MSQRQCAWCGQLGERVLDDCDLREPWANPHADGSDCVCRHVSAPSRLSAILAYARYWDGSAWVCTVCGTAPPPTLRERLMVAIWREEASR